MNKSHLCHVFYWHLFSLFHILLLNNIWLFVPFGDPDKWPNSEQISKSNSFKLWSVYLTNGIAGKVF